MMRLFDIPKVSLDKRIRLIELFGGIGTQAMALRDIGADFERWRLVEFDKKAVDSYNAVHGTSFVPMDIKNVHGEGLGVVECDKYDYMMVYSSPCTSLSVAGKMEGMKKDSGTASSLLWEVERLIEEMLELSKDGIHGMPKVLLMENVTQIHNKENIADFNEWLSFLKDSGYWSDWFDLAAPDFGIAQNRDRCFCVSIYSEEMISIEPPKPIPLTVCMNDFLETEVGDEFYLKSEKAEKLVKELFESGKLRDKDLQ